MVQMYFNLILNKIAKMGIFENTMIALVIILDI